MDNSPQKENGYTAIANEIMDELIKYRLPGEQIQCLLFILRKTYGYNKKTDSISLSQFVKATGINRGNVARAVKGLISKNLVYAQKGSVKKDTVSITKYRFNKRFGSWLISVKKDTGSVNIDRKVVSKKTHTKDIITKDKKIYSRVVDYLNAKTGKKFKSSSLKTKSLIDARINEKYKPEDFKTVIDNKVACYKLGDFEFKYLRPETLFGLKFEGYLNESCKPVNGVSEHIKKTPEQVAKEIEDALL